MNTSLSHARLGRADSLEAQYEQEHGHAWTAPKPARRARMCGGISDLLVPISRTPRDGQKVAAFWGAYQAAIYCGAIEPEARTFGDRAAAAPGVTQ
ncbi:hypothetical protein [Hydrogenophaga sp.]|uniref:hypothetical protein n=1 Tax=Hydrogenophaga sp. TaxID=1904254 RepID=UPI003D27ADA7